MHSDVVKNSEIHKYRTEDTATITSRRLTSLYTDYFKKIKEKANQRLQCIKHWGFHKDGLRPETALKLYKLLIRPILEYGAQVLIYDHYYLKPKLVAETSLDREADFVKQLEQFQTCAGARALRCLALDPEGRD